ncbi:hypothetical protein ACFWNT_46000 [Streptomyces sp. NPDC058409]|uniref:hypothetical protein n=1 Tax=Streptomyces sp. NPDC058409 TaxID=3346484 RepID=UPI003650A0DB
MTISLDKTAPGSEMRMGAVLRRALAVQGVNHRVGGGVEHGYLATTNDGPTVYIIAHSVNGYPHCDIPRGEHIGTTAVVTTDEGTSLVYDGTSANLRPVEDAEACARAVAAHLGTTPLCGTCEDYGFVYLYHPSTDAITGTTPCPDEACRQRGEERAARAAQMHTKRLVIGDEEFGPQVCAECSWGGYTPVPGQYALGQPVYVCTANGCGKTVDASVFGLDDGERLAVHDGRLYIARPYDGAPF